MRKILGALALALLCANVRTPAIAEDRTITTSGSVPSANQLNQQTRDDRIALGLLARDVLGSNVTNGMYANLAVVPNGGMYVEVQPANSGIGFGTVYQIKPEDPLPLPQNQAVQLSADMNPVVLIGQQNGPLGGIGPMTAPSSGNSVIYLVEAQIVVTDGANQTVKFQNPTGGGTTNESLPITRSDVINYQVIAGTPASSPVAPTATTGWVGIAQVTIPSGTTVITTGMIAPVAPFGGFIAAGGSPSVAGLTISSLGAGCLQTNSSGVVSSNTCTSGLGSVVGGFPITSSTSGGVASVGCPTCVTSLVGGTGVSVTSSTTPTVGLSHGDYLSLTGNQTAAGSKTFSSGITAPSLLSANSAGIADDGTSQHGLELSVKSGSTSGFQFINGAPGSGSVASTIDTGGDYYLQPTSSTACISLNAGEVVGCPTISNSSDGGMNFTDVQTSSLGFRWLNINSGGIGELASLTNSGVFSLVQPGGQIVVDGLGQASSASIQTQGDILVQRGSTNTGAIFWGNAASAYEYWTGSNFTFNQPINVPSVGLTFAGSTGLGYASSSAAGGISCSAFDIYNVNSPYTTYACYDMSGNEGIAGNYYAASQRKLKSNIRSYGERQAFDVAMRTRIVRYCYKREHCKRGETRHIGFIADDTSKDIAPAHKSADLNAVGAVGLAAIQYLQGEIAALKNQIKALQGHH